MHLNYINNFIEIKMIKKRSDCPVSYALDILGDRWMLLIIRDLLFHGKNTYSDFLKSDEKIATNILADRLQKLENEEIIKKKTSNTNKNKFLYTLTQKGIDLLPVLLELIIWSDKYSDFPEKIKSLADKVKNNRDEVIDKIILRLSSNT